MSDPLSDPLAPDAPLIQLLSIRDNPILATLDEARLVALVRKLRQHATSAPTLAAADNEAGKRVSPRSNATAAKRAVLDTL